MTIRRLSGPEPIVVPADVPGSHASDDALIVGAIAGVQASIDGPTGWLGRSLGAQQLELTTDRLARSIRLPFEPVTNIISVKYRDRAGVLQTIDESNYRVASGNRCQFGTGFALPETDCTSDSVTIVYDAGYAAGGMPESAKRAVIIGVQQSKPMTDQSVMLRSENVEGVGEVSYAASEATGELVRRAIEALLAPLRVHWL